MTDYVSNFMVFSITVIEIDKSNEFFFLLYYNESYRKKKCYDV